MLDSSNDDDDVNERPRRGGPRRGGAEQDAGLRRRKILRICISTSNVKKGILKEKERPTFKKE